MRRNHFTAVVTAVFIFLLENENEWMREPVKKEEENVNIMQGMESFSMLIAILIAAKKIGKKLIKIEEN